MKLTQASAVPAPVVGPWPGDGIDDRTLVERTLHGDRAAFATIMRRHNRRLYRLARATLRDDAEAEDALQDAYLAAYRSLAQYRHDAAFATWLSRVVLNQCYSRLRRTSRRENVIPIAHALDQRELESVADPAEGLDAAVMRLEMRRLIERKLDELPGEFRLVFVLREIEELTVGDVAAMLDIPEATVRSRAFRARTLLRAALARELDVAESDAYEFGGARCDRIVGAVLARLQEDEIAPG